MTELAAYMERFLPLIECELRDLPARTGAVPEFYAMMRYHLGWLDENLQPKKAPKGKRLRPILCLLACEAVGGDVEVALPAAVAIELIHNFSLIHDDIEDDSPTRRHRPTVWALWGVPQAINCGDGMFAAAILKIGALRDRGVPASRVLDAERILVDTCLALTEGQYMDMTFEVSTKVDIDRYLLMIQNKSAALISCAAQLGALLGGADPETVRACAQFGENLGMAFQVIDDILGVWGAEDVTGKSASTDILARKKSLPVVYALADAELRAIYAQDEMEADDVAQVVAILEREGARDFAERVAGEYSTAALDRLEQASLAAPARQAIEDLARSLLTDYLPVHAPKE
jgi:geranylgeranyl diphosphate synthase type I